MGGGGLLWLTWHPIRMSALPAPRFAESEPCETVEDSAFRGKDLSTHSTKIVCPACPALGGTNLSLNPTAKACFGRTAPFAPE
jgi:hypothetical protein